jgi:hypothetical protein
VILRQRTRQVPVNAETVNVDFDLYDYATNRELGNAQATFAWKSQRSRCWILSQFVLPDNVEVRAALSHFGGETDLS